MEVTITKRDNHAPDTHFFSNSRVFSLFLDLSEGFDVYGCVVGNKGGIRRSYKRRAFRKYETAWRYAYRRMLGAVR